MLFWHFEQELQTALQVAAPQQEAVKVRRVPILGNASSGRDRAAPMLACVREMYRRLVALME